ncbi:MAG TPA: protein-disulfide reductase DsbD domain-containing protein [Stellaceae bacterium]|nr:protein-disulfide reductase DsbD domain-containing protein [Stellaceae bacterium]
MRRSWFASGWVAAALLLWMPRAADAAATAWVGDDHAAARLITATDAVGSARAVEAGLEIRLAPGWHAYWRTPGDAGVPPAIDWTGSTNLKQATMAWPAPARYSLQGFETAGYRNHVVLPIALTPAQPGQPLDLHAQIGWAACANICVPYSARLDLTLPSGPAVPSAQAPLIVAARGRVPRSPAMAGISLVSANAAADGRQTELIIGLHSAGVPFAAPDLFVEGLAEGSPGRPEVALSQSGHMAVLRVPIRDAATTQVVGKPLTLTMVDGARAAQFTATPRLALPPIDRGRLLPMLAVALLGGLILNAMPCVLPVLSLKLLAVASHAGAERRRVRFGLLMTALGVIASFGLIAAVLIGLKASGAAIGWGIQFQWPWFIAAMAAVTTLFAASLWGWLPILLPRFAYEAAAEIRAATPYGDAFLTGAFATLLATPCSAPFVGTAIGFALAQGPAEIAIVFAALGIGMAVPYLAVAAFPQVVRLLPRPGWWMHAVRIILGLALAGTAIWLLFVLAALSGTPVALTAAAALAALVVVLAMKRRAVIPAAASRMANNAAVALVAAAILYPAFAGIAAPRTAAMTGRWHPFNPHAIQQLVGQGKIVFVDVTAAWCLTCKVNEAAVLDRDPVAGRLFAPGVVAMRGDWTRPDPALTRYLESFGRYGIPFNAVYGPGRPHGELLPELLTAGAVERALDQAGARG